MKNLKTTIFSITLLGTTFVALGYFCEKCRIDHERLSECAAFIRGPDETRLELMREYIANLVKQDSMASIKRHEAPGDKGSFQYIFSRYLSLREFELQYSEFCNLGLECCLKVRKFFEDARADVNGRIRDYYTARGQCAWETISDWSEVFGSDCETTPALPNHGDGWNEGSNEPDPWDSGYSNSPFGC